MNNLSVKDLESLCNTVETLIHFIKKKYLKYFHHTKIRYYFKMKIKMVFL